MTPTAEWYEADADDSDRSIADDVTTNAHETTARAATETDETGAGVHGAADLLRKRTAALDRVAAENERLRAEVERLQGEVEDVWVAISEASDEADESTTQAQYVRRIGGRAEAAEAKLRDVEAVLDSWPKYRTDDRSDYGRAVAQCRVALRAVLARSQAPQAPAEQEGCEGRVGWGSR